MLVTSVQVPQVQGLGAFRAACDTRAGGGGNSPAWTEFRTNQLDSNLRPVGDPIMMTQQIVEALRSCRITCRPWHGDAVSRVYLRRPAGDEVGYLEVAADGGVTWGKSTPGRVAKELLPHLNAAGCRPLN